MNLEKFVAVSGMPGLFKLVANRNNGLILEDLSSGKRKFVPSRGNQFTPLGTIGIYTNDGDSTELKIVFQNMLDRLADLPPVEVGAGHDVLRSYFAQILPEYDRDKVSISDIKKTIKWFSFLNERNLLAAEAVEEEEE
ncbi:MAG: DUF5606 domain-containing protein [Saprospiraceae bacterium]|jgi:hypothetical protein